MADTQALRPELYRDPVDASHFGVVEKPLSTWERIYNVAAVRKIFILVALAAIWELYARLLNNPLLFPTFTSTIEAFVQGLFGGGVAKTVADGHLDERARQAERFGPTTRTVKEP